MSSTHQHGDQDAGDISKQRASKACNRCRAKKARCSGGYPCSKCKASDGVCIFGYPKKSKRKTFPEHYVRALEMQQFKLVAGLQTMYAMLLAADSWPGSQLAEHKGNPLAHDILERLGLVEHEEHRDIFDENASDRQSSSDGTSAIHSPHRPPDQSPEPHGRKPSISTPGLGSQQSLFSKADESQLDVNFWHTHPMHQPYHIPLLPPCQLSTEVGLGSSSKVISSFSGDLLSAQGVEAGNQTTIDLSATWWSGNLQTAEATPYSSTSFAPAPFATHIAVGNSMIPAPEHQSSYFVDPGVYTSDFDVER